MSSFRLGSSCSSPSLAAKLDLSSTRVHSPSTPFILFSASSRSPTLLSKCYLYFSSCAAFRLSCPTSVYTFSKFDNAKNLPRIRTDVGLPSLLTHVLK